MAPISHREWLEAFIELYKSEPCLWKIKSTEYYDRSKKDAAYEKLINKLREIESTATRETVIKKINNLRCTYKKEYKKVQASKANSSETVYEPKLWYYSLLSFLDSQEASRPLGCDDKTLEMNQLKLYDVASGSGTDTEQTTMSEEDWKSLRIKGRNSTEINGSFSGCATDESYSGWSPKTNGRLSTDLKDPHMPQRFNTPVKEDRCDIVGRLVTLKLRDLSKEQGLLAEKIINEALFKAEMGELTSAHGIAAADANARGSACCTLCNAVLLDLPVPVLEFGAIDGHF